MSNVIKFPGTGQEKETTPAEVFKTASEMPFKYVVIVGVLDTDHIAALGNTNVPVGVYLMQQGNSILLEQVTV